MIRNFFMPALAGLLCAPCFAQSIQAFTTRDHPLTNASGIPVIFLDRHEAIEERFSEALSDDPQEVLKEASLLIDSPEWQMLQHQLSTAYSGLVVAWRLGIAKVPAVVVDEQYVVYGQSDVQAAIERISVFRDGGETDE